MTKQQIARSKEQGASNKEQVASRKQQGASRTMRVAEHLGPRSPCVSQVVLMTNSGIPTATRKPQNGPHQPQATAEWLVNLQSEVHCLTLP